MREAWTWACEAFHNTKLISPQELHQGFKGNHLQSSGDVILVRGPVVQGSQKL